MLDNNDNNNKIQQPHVHFFGVVAYAVFLTSLIILIKNE